MNQSLIASLKCSVMDKVLLSIWQTSIFVSDCHFFVSWNWRRSFCRDYVFHLDNKCVFFVGGTPVGKRFYDLLGMWGMFWWSGNETPCIGCWFHMGFYLEVNISIDLTYYLTVSTCPILLTSFQFLVSLVIYLYSGLKLRLICFEYNKYNIFN